MENIQYTITLDLHRDLHQVIVMKEGDVNTREIIATITNDGSPYDITGLTANFKWKKPDNTMVNGSCVSIDSHTVKIPCDAQMLAVAGIAECEVALYGSNDNSLSTHKFWSSLKPTVVPDSAIESTSEFGALTDALSQVNAMQGDMEAAVTSCTNSATNAATSATNAGTSESNALSYKNAAETSATNAATSESNASTSATNASTSETNADSHAKLSESYAVGNTGTRDGENTDNSKYYMEQARDIVSSVSNALKAKGTILFANLPTTDISTGDMYNISDAFTSDSRFKDGGDIQYKAGNNVYYTDDGKWDVLQGNMNDYLLKTGDSQSNVTSFGEATTLTNIDTGETHSTMFGKIKKAITKLLDLDTLMGSTNISAIGGGTCTGAISTLSSKITTSGAYEMIVDTGWYPQNIGDTITYTIDQNKDITKYKEIAFLCVVGDSFQIVRYPKALSGLRLGASTYVAAGYNGTLELTFNYTTKTLSIYLRARAGYSATAFGVNQIFGIY